MNFKSFLSGSDDLKTIARNFLREFEKDNKKEGAKLSGIEIQVKSERKVGITTLITFNPDSKWLDSEWRRKFFHYKFNNFKDYIKELFEKINADVENISNQSLALYGPKQNTIHMHFEVEFFPDDYEY